MLTGEVGVLVVLGVLAIGCELTPEEKAAAEERNRQEKAAMEETNRQLWAEAEAKSAADKAKREAYEKWFDAPPPGNEDIALSYEKEGNFKNITRQYEEALKLFELAAKESRDPLMIARCNGSMGQVYEEMESFDAALRFLEASNKQFLNLLRTKQDIDRIAIHNDLGINWMAVSGAYRQQKKFDQAESAIRQSVNWYTKNNDEEHVAQCYQFLGEIFIESEQYVKAEAVLDDVQSRIGRNDPGSGDRKTAAAFLTFLTGPRWRAMRANVYDSLSLLYEKTGRYEEACLHCHVVIGMYLSEGWLGDAVDPVLQRYQRCVGEQARKDPKVKEVAPKLIQKAQRVASMLKTWRADSDPDLDTIRKAWEN